MKIIKVEQNTPEWHKWRSNGIGASDAPIILGESPWTKPEKLFRIKMGLETQFTGNAATRRGHDLEPAARAWYEKEMNVKMSPACVEHEFYPFIRASLDGYNGTFIGLEIKCPGAEAHHKASRGQIPDYYKAQLDHQMLAADLQEIHYLSFDGKNGIVLRYLRDEKRESKLIRAEEIFWNKVLEGSWL